MNLKRIGQIAAVKSRGGPAMLAGIVTINGQPINLQLRPAPGRQSAYDVWVVGNAPPAQAHTKAQPLAAVGYKSKPGTANVAELREAVNLLSQVVNQAAKRVQNYADARRTESARADRELRALRSDVAALRQSALAARRTRRFFNLP